MKKNYTEEEKSEIIKEIELNLQMEIEEIEEKFLGEANEYFRNSLIKNAKIHAEIKIAYVVQTKEEFKKTLGDSLSKTLSLINDEFDQFNIYEGSPEVDEDESIFNKH